MSGGVSPLDRPPGLSLAPGGSVARSPRTCTERATAGQPPGRAERLARQLAVLSDAFASDYPENLFCDLDALAGHLARLDEATAAQTVEQMVGLSRQFGRGGLLRFRFVHDFVYGFDWCRWAAKEPSTRAAIGPYDLRFLGYLSRRGTEIEGLIAQGDAKYGPLPEGVYRNPFGFARDVESEAWLLRELSRRGSLPLECWRCDAAARVVPFAAEREALAGEAGLLRPVATAGSASGGGA